MKKAGRRFHRIFRAVFAAALALAITGANLAPAAAVTWADVNELKDEANGLDAEKKELQAKLDALADDKSQAVARKELLDQQIANTEAQIANTQAQIDRYAALITQTEAELVEAEEKEAAQYELFCSRVREMEKQDEVSYWAVLFRASSFTDLLGRLDAINEIMKYDQGVIDDLKALQAEIEEKKATLESSKAETEAAKAELVSKAHIARAVLDAIAFQVTDLVQAMNADAPCPITTLRVDGGASVSDIMMQTQADLLRLPVDRPAQVETTAFGAAALAGLAAGVWGSLEEVAALRRSQHVFLPQRPQAACEAQYRLWRRAVDRALRWIENDV